MSRSVDPPPSPARHALALGTLVLLALALILSVARFTEPRVSAARATLVERRLAEVLPPGRFDRPRPGDRVVISAPGLGSAPPLPIERRFREGEAAAAILSVIAPDGYNGDIALLVGVDADGRIAGVRVTAHRETPGLGDDIERRRSTWIESFDGLALGDLPDSGWAVRARGGRFDAFTGATLTPQAVVRAVHGALHWFERHREPLFALPRE